MNRARAWLASNYDVILFAIALVSVGPLMAWWSVLVRRNILHTDQLLRAQIETTFDGAQRTERIATLDETTHRQLFMIGGESAMAGVLIFVLAVALFAVARHRRRETERLQSMLSLTTHQLKTPLAGVRALLQSLGNGAIPADAQARFINQGVAECDRLEHLVETTLAYQRTVAHAGKLEPIATRTLVSEILEHRRASFPEDEVTWTPGTGVQVICDRDAVRVVLENLLDNARKYGGGKVELAEVSRNTKWRLEVRDRGQGFETRDAERLFEPFERGSGGKGVAHGSGLGLYISRQLARRMRGELTAKSDGPGQGSTFALELEVSRG